jgi:hypothetical protein
MCGYFDLVHSIQDHHSIKAILSKLWLMSIHRSTTLGDDGLTTYPMDMTW